MLRLEFFDIPAKNHLQNKQLHFSKRYKEANNEIRKLQQGKEEIRQLLNSRIFSEDDWNST